MKWIGTGNLGMLLLGIWLVATGVLAFVHPPLANMHQIMAGLALVAGVCILIGR